MGRSPDTEATGTAFKAAYIAVAVALASVFYVLSMGPLLWLSDHGYLSDSVRQFLSRVYEPLWVVASYVPPLKQFLHWYVSLWA